MRLSLARSRILRQAQDVWEREHTTLVERWRHPPYWSRPCCGVRQPQARASDANDPTIVDRLVLNLLMTPCDGNFRSGDGPGHGLVVRREVQCREQACYGQWAGVTGLFFFSWICRMGRMIWDFDNGLRDSGLVIERPAVPYKRVTGLRVCGASRYYRRIVQVSYGLVELALRYVRVSPQGN